MNLKHGSFTLKEIEWFKTNYPHVGIRVAMKKLKRNKSSIRGLAVKLGIKVSQSTFARLATEGNDKRFVPKTNLDDWINVKKPEIAYILGLLWADGYISNKQRFHIRIALVKKDLDEILWIFDKIGKWTKCERQPKVGKLQLILGMSCGTELINYLVSKDYKDKSYKAPHKILKTIPKHLKHYFFRGYLDGDGCIGLNSYIIGFSSGYNQNWKFLPKTFNIRRWINNKGHKGSEARLCRKHQTLNYCKRLYHNAEKDKLYLPRKYERYLILIKKANKNKHISKYRLNK